MHFYIRQKKPDATGFFLPMPDLEEYLSQKPLYYTEIDYSRMPRAWRSISRHFRLPKIIHVIGTNGKGSTGRFLAHHLYKSGFSVGHYTSPHILRFNERIWRNGADVEDAELARCHDRLYHLLSTVFRETLSYFEYTTLLAIALFEECDYVVLEAGLGGEHDATAVFDNILTLVTPIDFDHMDFLGESIEDIATTKLNAIQKAAILATQKHQAVYTVAKKQAKSKGVDIFKSRQFHSDKEIEAMRALLKSLSLPLFFENNLMLAMAAVKFLGLDVKLENMKDVVLFGRAQKIADNIMIDVGHNALAASALCLALKGKKINLVFNTFADKDYEKTLTILQSAIKKIEIIPILNERIEKKENLIKVIEKLQIPYGDFTEIDEKEEYLVFGSFSVVEAFLKLYAKTEKSEFPT